MTFEPNYEKLVSSFRRELGRTQSVIECKLPSEQKISKILCSNARSVVDNYELVNKTLNYNGFVGFQIIFIDENNMIDSIDYTAEFKDKFDLLSDYENTVLILESTVVDIKTELTEAGVRVTAIIDVLVDGIESNVQNALVSINSENTFSKNELINYVTYLGVASEKFDVIEELELKDSVDKILSVCPIVNLESVVPANNFITIKGTVNVNICYLSAGETLLPRTSSYSFEFTREIAKEGVTDTSIIQSDISVWINDVKVTTIINADNTNINLLVPIYYKGYVFNNNTIDAITDLINTKFDMAIDYQSFSSIESASSAEFSERISGNATLEETMPFIDEVLGNCCDYVINANSKIEEGRLVVEGVAYTTVLYYNKETNSIHSNEIEMPYSIVLNSQNYYEGYTPVVKVSIGEVSVKGRRGKDIDVTAMLFVYADFYNTKNEVVIQNVLLQDEKIVDDLVLFVYVVKDGETIWDIAKNMLISPETILEQNPELELPLKAGDKIVIYKQENVEF